MGSKKPSAIRKFSTFINNQELIIILAITVFWLFYWLLNVIDKITFEGTFLWLGKNRFLQFVNYFASIGITDIVVSIITLTFVSIVEFSAFIAVGISLVYFIKKNVKMAQRFFYYSSIIGLGLFTFFSLGDQVFGDRVELWEHTSYWVIVLVTLFFYNYNLKKFVNKKDNITESASA